MARLFVTLIIAFTFGIVLASCAVPSQPDTAHSVLARSDDLFAAGREREALDTLSAAARLGLPAAQAELAMHHARGESVPRSFVKAESLLRSAIAGDPQAEYQRNLACVLYQQRDDEDLPEAVGLLQKAIGGGDVLAEVYISRFHRFGVGMPRSVHKANGTLERAFRRLYMPPEPRHRAAERQRFMLAAALASPWCGPIDKDAVAAAQALQRGYEAGEAQDRDGNASNAACRQNRLGCQEFLPVLLAPDL
ncbi:MAG: hypothetical protein RLN70_05075 [Rhodospirillaceae bacterium]